MTSKQEILTYLAPSRVCQGVGVFAYINIPKDTIIFPVTQNKDFIKIPWTKVTNRARQKIKELTSGSDETGFYTDVDINRFDISYYVFCFIIYLPSFIVFMPVHAARKHAATEAPARGGGDDLGRSPTGFAPMDREAHAPVLTNEWVASFIYARLQ